MVLENLIIKEIGLSLDLFRRLVGECDEVILKKKEYLLRQGQVCSFIGFVETGVLRSYIEKEGEDYISDFHFLTIEASVGSIQALENSVLYCLSKSNYDQLLQTSNEGYKLGKYIADTLFIKKCRKETSLLMDDALERYKLLLRTYPHIEQHVSQYHIASYLGIKPESLSRLKSLNIGQ